MAEEKTGMAIMFQDGFAKYGSGDWVKRHYFINVDEVTKFKKQSETGDLAMTWTPAEHARLMARSADIKLEPKGMRFNTIPTLRDKKDAAYRRLRSWMLDQPVTVGLDMGRSPSSASAFTWARQCGKTATVTNVLRRHFEDAGLLKTKEVSFMPQQFHSSHSIEVLEKTTTDDVTGEDKIVVEAGLFAPFSVNAVEKFAAIVDADEFEDDPKARKKVYDKIGKKIAAFLLAGSETTREHRNEAALLEARGKALDAAVEDVYARFKRDYDV